MNIELMRQALIKVYPGRAWHDRVVRMSEGQVVAVYNRFRNEKKI